MIRTKKSGIPPQTLAEKGYSDDEVKRRLLSDQHDKCYLCERKLTTDYEVEHLHSQGHYELLINDWDNLYIACNYCNDRKKDKYDQILNPDKNDIECLIRHIFLPRENKFRFDIVDQTVTDEETLTVDLLSRLFNGGKIRNLKEQRFYDTFLYKFNVFSQLVDDYLSNKTDKSREMLESQLSIDSEYLGFKYTIIKQNALLDKEFGKMVVWNK